MAYYRDSGQKLCTGPDLNMILVLSLGRADQKLLNFTLLIIIPQFTLLSNSSVILTKNIYSIHTGKMIIQFKSLVNQN